MKLRLERAPAVGCTIGELTVDGAFECFVLEDVERAVKVYGETAIPKGTYNVITTLSHRFQRELPLLENVPGFEGVRIHPGNYAADTHGCLLPGRTRTDRAVGESKAAFNALYAKIRQALDDGDVVTVEIV